MSSSSFPWQYSFPPFFTLQPHAETRAKQLAVWRAIVLDYCQRNKITTLDVEELLLPSSSSPLFHNAELRRRLPPAAVLTVLDDLQQHGHLEWIDPKDKTRAHIYWRTPDEWASLIYGYAQENGLAQTVCTFYELTESDDAKDQPFHGLEQDMLVKALKALELQKKAEIFDNNEGVKFF